MSYADAAWLREALAHASMDQQQLADELSRRLNRAFLKSTINKMAMLKETEKTKRRAIKADEMFAISDITGYPARNEQAGKAQPVKLLDLISAGKLAPGRQIEGDDILGELITSGLSRGEWIALKVDGNSMNKIAPPGAIIFVDRSDQRLVAERLYVFQDERGNGTFKMFRDNKPRMVPLSDDDRHEPQRLPSQAVVIGRVRRVVVDLD